jgi:hypothetical protein
VGAAPDKRTGLTRRARLPVAAAVAWVIILGTIAVVTSPYFTDLDRYGGHDWDSVTFFRYFTVQSIKRFHQFPFWDPYACGGHDAWGYIDSDTTVVSPWLPLYLFADLRLALRIETAGMALISALGVWTLAGRFTRSAGARCFACVVWAINGRWAGEIGVGHTWHLYYAWMPWVLYFYDRAQGFAEPPWRAGWWKGAAAAGAFVALMVYNGGLYPLPHTAVMLAFYGIYMAVRSRSLQPLAAGAVTVAVGFGLSAPRLLAIADQMRRAPRIIESNETMDLGSFVQMLTGTSQFDGGRPTLPLQWGWHEWGIYVGWGALVLLFYAFAVRGPREGALKWLGALLVALAFGNFHEYAPWNQLHNLPMFRSLHVPSRWAYPAVLALGLVAASGLGRWVERARQWRVVADLALLGVVLYIARDIASVSREALTHSFWMELHPTPAGEFRTQTQPDSLRYSVSDWSQPALPAAMANVGIVECYAVGTLNAFAKDETGHRPPIGALGTDQPGYRGEVFVAEGPGHASFARWTPNELTVNVDGAREGDTLIVNTNYDAGWRADGAPVLDVGHRVGVRLHGGHETIFLKFRSRTLWIGLALAALTIGALEVARRRSRAVA